MVRSQKYSFKKTLEEAGPKMIQTLYNFEGNWSRSVSA